MDTSLLLSTVIEGIAPPQRLSVSEWAAKKRYLSAESSAEPGRWKNDRTPYLVGIMDAICEPGVHEICVMCSAQVGKTESESNILGRQIDLDPCPILFLQPTLEMAQTYSKDRFSPMVRDTPVLREKVANRKSRDKNNTILHKLFPGGQVTFAGANSPASLASRPVRMVLCDEIDRYPLTAGTEGDPVNLARKRTSTFWNWLVFLVSTPTIKGISRIEKAYESSDQRKYFVPCPHCNHYQVFNWDNIEYANKGTKNADPKSGVTYLCEKCDRPIKETSKSQMLKAGEWRATASNNFTSVGFYLNELYSPWRRWTDIALDYEAAKDDPYMFRVWYNTSLGLPFELLEGEKVEWERLYHRGLNSDYKVNYVPMGGLILTAGVDVQGNRLECSIWAWGRNSQSWLIAHEVILGDPLKDKVWRQLDEVLLKEYLHESGKKLKITATCIDSGYITQDVYAQVKKRKHQHCYAIKGAAGENRPLVSRPTYQEMNYRGKVIKQGIRLYTLGVDTAKQTLYARSKIEKPGAKYINFPNNLDVNWYEGFCSEVMVTKHRYNQPYYVWEKLPGVDNEPLDCAIYALAAAYLAGVTRVRWSKLEADILAKEEEKEEPPEEKKVEKKKAKKTRKKDWVLNGRQW